MATKKKKDFSQPTEIPSAASAFMSIPQSNIQEEELDFIENKWDKIEPKIEVEGNTKSSGKGATNHTTPLATTNDTRLTTKNSGKISRMLWNKSYSETKRNFQYTLSERQQNEFKAAAEARGYTRKGRMGQEPNASKFFQDLIDCSAWEALEFLNDAELWEEFQSWKQNQNF